MAGHGIFETFFLIFSGSAILATLALFTKQPLIIAYIALGIFLGPSGLDLLHDAELIKSVADIGIVLLLYLLGLDMQPRALISTLKQSTPTALISSVFFAAGGMAIALIWGFEQSEAMVIGLAMMFSSTIIGIKLLPTTVLHHKHMGELMVGLLLLQDVIAIVCLLVLGQDEASWQQMSKALLALPLLGGIAFALVKFAIIPLLAKFDRYQEFVFLLSIGWCLGIAQLAGMMGLSHEMGAFIAGVSLAQHPISQYITTSLRPLRDFFLVMFFFTLGAGYDIGLLPTVWLPALALAVFVLIAKPLTFRLLLARFSEKTTLAWDIGFRMGQISEFSLLLSYIALQTGKLSEQGLVLIQSTAILTFIISSYIVVFSLPNPIAVKEHLRRD